MTVVDRLFGLLPREAAERLREVGGTLTEVRVRTGRPVELVSGGVGELVGDPVEASWLRGMASALMEHSVYARETELARGYFTLSDGSRVGVCGRRYPGESGYSLGEIGSICVRIARQVPGCADELMKALVEDGRVYSTLLLSPPGMGKTTMLRDIARQLSEGGFCVAIADERHELAACRQGVPTMDVGPRTDVMDGCPRPTAIRQMVRAMAPDVIIADEIGGKGDARALADAVRCGVAVVASAHAQSVEMALRRPKLRAIMNGGSLRHVVVLGGAPGRIVDLRRLDAPGREGGQWSSD